MLNISETFKTTVPIKLKFSGIIGGFNKLAVLKFQSNLGRCRKNVPLECWEICIIGLD